MRLRVQNEFFPRWDEIKAEHVKPGILHILADLDKELSVLEENVKPTWESLVDPLERITDRISRAWGTVSHLKVRTAFLTHHTNVSTASKQQGKHVYSNNTLLGWNFLRSGTTGLCVSSLILGFVSSSLHMAHAAIVPTPPLLLRVLRGLHP